MKNKQEILGLVANISLVVLVFCFIVAGLNIIGIYSLPKPIEMLLGTYDKDQPMLFGNDDIMQEFANFDENSPDFKAVNLGYEDANNILNNIEAASDYSHKVVVSHSFDGKKRTESFDIRRVGGLYSVNVYDAKGYVLRTISQNSDNTVIITEPSVTGEYTPVVNGNFSISDECGFVLTVDEFLNSGYELSDAEYSMFTKDDTYFVSVEFDYTFNNQVARQKYVISLDFGVVTEVYSYVDGVAVYEMTTQILAF